MSTRSLLKSPGNPHRGAWITRIVSTAIAVLVFGHFPGVTVLAAATASPANVCKQTSQLLLGSCRSGAHDQFLLDSAKCANLSNAAARQACQNQAAADRKDEVSGNCPDQYEARLGVCDGLGPAAYDPPINPANFTTTINNPFFPLVPGTTFVYEADTPDGHEVNNVVVTSNTRVIDGVTCREVHDTVKVAGKLTEDTLDFYAQDLAGNVWYFGENSQSITNGLVDNIDGSWLGGVDNDKPGIIMEAASVVGDFYRQEYSPDNAEDMAKVLSLSETVTGSFGGTHNNCIKTEETTPLEPDALENKFYCSGFGVVKTVDITEGTTETLTNIIPPGP